MSVYVNNRIRIHDKLLVGRLARYVATQQQKQQQQQAFGEGGAHGLDCCINRKFIY